MNTLSVGDYATVRKYGLFYECQIVKVTPTRYQVEFTQKSGRTVRRWVPQSEVLA